MNSLCDLVIMIIYHYISNYVWIQDFSERWRNLCPFLHLTCDDNPSDHKLLVHFLRVKPPSSEPVFTHSVIQYQSSNLDLSHLYHLNQHFSSFFTTVQRSLLPLHVFSMSPLLMSIRLLCFMSRSPSLSKTFLLLSLFY
jgi:hypothetical protein